jgi:hypothetical protein
MELLKDRVRTPYLFDIPGPGAIRTLLKLLSIMLAVIPWDHSSRLFECKPGRVECRDLLHTLALLQMAGYASPMNMSQNLLSKNHMV